MKQIVLEQMDRCAVCHRAFNPDDIHVISRKPDLWTMVVECTDCHARNFVAAIMNEGDPQQAQLALRELTEQTMRDLAERPRRRLDIEPEAPPTGEPVTAGDVVDMHLFLQDFDGDFKFLFSEPRG